MIKDKDTILNAFAELLENHNWNYHSGDHKTLEKGLDSAMRIAMFIKSYPCYRDELKSMHEEANPFNNNKTII